MKCTILHETRGRMRVHTMQGAMSLQQADILEAYLNRVSGVTKATVYDRTGDAVICYDGPRETVTKALSSFAYAKEQALAPEHSSRALNRDFEDKLVASLCWRGIKQLFVPSSVRTLITVARSVPYIKAGMTCLMHRKIQVPVLDATAITVSMLRKDFKTASSIMFLLGIGDILDEWTHKKSVADLAQTMSLNVDKVWKETDAGSVLVPVADVQVGDRIVIHTGNVIYLRIGARWSSGRQPSMSNITIQNVYAEVPAGKPDKGYDYEGPQHHMPRNISPCGIVGLSDHDITNVTLRNIKIIYPGGGNPFFAYRGLTPAELDSIPEARKSYPEFSQFRELPAWGFYIRHAKNITMDNVQLIAQKPDYRPAIVLDDVHGIKFDNVTYTEPGAEKKQQLFPYQSTEVTVNQ